MNEPFLLFQSFNDPELAREVGDRLKVHDISFQIEDTSSPIDPVIIGSGLDPDIRIKLKQRDFEKAHSILESYYDTAIESVDKDYYLFEFTDEELYEILEKKDEWGYFDYKLAEKILKSRGKEVDFDKLESIRSARMQEISKPEKVKESWIIVGYVLAIFFGLIGIFYGLTILTMKKTLPDGQRVNSYHEDSRRHAKNILILSSIMMVAGILSKILLAKFD